MNRNYPKITISEEGEKWLDNGQMWMYKNNVVKLAEEIENGALVDIVTTKDRYLGTGFLSRNSHITVRILSKDTADTFDRAFFKERIQFAYAYRKTLESKNITNCRLIFGEADQLPGLTVDRYNDILVSQISSYGLEQRKDMLYEVLLEVLREDGQDVKGIAVDTDGTVKTFAMNDKCAAGTGRFFESMANAFEMSLEEFSKLSLTAENVIPITAQCTVFAESEVITLVGEGKPRNEIAAGIQQAVAKRCFVMAKKAGAKDAITLTGGCAKNQGLKAAIEKVLRMKVIELKTDPQLMGALGAAEYARQKGLDL